MVALARARLDRALLTRGEDGLLRRRIGSGSTFVEITVRCLPRGYRPAELSGGIMQGDTMVIVSPTALLNAGAAWPGAAGGTVVPKALDQFTFQGRLRSVIAASPFYESGELVRIELQVRG